MCKSYKSTHILWSKLHKLTQKYANDVYPTTTQWQGYQMIVMEFTPICLYYNVSMHIENGFVHLDESLKNRNKQISAQLR